MVSLMMLCNVGGDGSSSSSSPEAKILPRCSECLSLEIPLLARWSTCHYQVRPQRHASVPTRLTILIFDIKIFDHAAPDPLKAAAPPGLDRDRGFALPRQLRPGGPPPCVPLEGHHRRSHRQELTACGGAPGEMSVYGLFSRCLFSH